jgi:hypothetical protein
MKYIRVVLVAFALMLFGFAAQAAPVSLGTIEHLYGRDPGRVAPVSLGTGSCCSSIPSITSC